MYHAHSLESGGVRRWQPLRDHLLAVAGRAEVFASRFGAGAVARIAGICHDLGKYSLEFQERLNDPRVHVDHSTAGARLAAQTYGALGRIIAYVVAGHHSGLPDGSGASDGCLTNRIQFKDIPDCSAYSQEIVLPPRTPMPNLKRQPGQPGFTVAFFIRMLFSCLVDADFLDTEQFMDLERAVSRGAPQPLSVLASRLDSYLRSKMSGAPDTPVNRIRARVLADCNAAAARDPGLFTLTVPTGGGKTLSSLSFAVKHALAHGLDRIIYVIPFTSIIEQNAAVFREAVGASSVLEHHSNAAYEGGKPGEDQPQRLDLAAENWDIPVIVTTNVQFFESLFSNRGSRCRKVHNITKSVVILDEAQMLPVELLRPCVAALVELVENYGSTVVLCSATQPALGGLLPQDLAPREIARDPAELYAALRRVRVKNAGVVDNEALARRLAGCVQALCIVNTRAHARNIFERLGRGDGQYHLSAAMTPVHRRARLREIRARLDRGEVCRVVSTQLVEAGVDVDFPLVMRAVAGIDSIAQAAGRCNREGRRDYGEVFVFTPAGGEGLSHVWFKRTSAIAATILEESDDPLDLGAVKRYFNDLYFYEGAQLDAHGIMRKLEAEVHQLNFPFEQVANAFKVIGDDTVGIVVPHDDRCRDLLARVDAVGISRSLARKLQAYTVPVRVWEFLQLRDAGVLDDIGGLPVLRDMRLYDDTYGLVADKAEDVGGECWIV